MCLRIIGDPKISLLTVVDGRVHTHTHTQVCSIATLLLVVSRTPYCKKLLSVNFFAYQHEVQMQMHNERDPVFTYNKMFELLCSQPCLSTIFVFALRHLLLFFF